MSGDAMLSETKAWLLDHMPYQAMWMNRRGKLVFTNYAFCEALGYNKKELSQLTIYDVNPRVTPEQWEKHWAEVEAEKTVNFKTLHKKKSGHVFEVEVVSQFFSNNGNDLICAIVHEITQSSFYKRVLDTAEQLVKVGGWKLNLQDQSMIATGETYRIFGVERSVEVMPANVVRFFDDPVTFQKLISNAITKGHQFDEVLSIHDSKGRKKWLRCVGIPVLINDQIKKVIGVYQDITTQYNNILSLQLFREIIDQSEDIVFVWEENGDLFHHSNSASKQLGFTNEELANFTIYDLDKVIDEKWWKDHFRDIKHRKHFRLEWMATRKDGSTFPVDIAVNHLFFENRHLNCAVLRDISAMKRQEQDLRDAFEQIEKLKNQLEKENEYLQEEIKRTYNFDNIICKSDAYKEVLNTVEQVAPTDTTVLITGESGTGKELLASAIHNNSVRKDNVLVKVNCATLPRELFESELFGHKKGSFTGATADKTGKFAVAHKGTIFLDEIGELPLELQPKLLRVLQEGEFDVLGDAKTTKVDVRIIAATNRDLSKMVGEGTFREDLYYRLNVFPIHNLPLRDRREDVPLLAQFFLEKYALKAGKQLRRISKKTLEAFSRYHFPGNIRELENLIERAVIIENGTTLYPGTWMPVTDTTAAAVADGFKTFEQMQRDYIIRVLEKTGWKVSGTNGAAAILDMNAKTLFARMKKLGIEKEVSAKRRGQ